METGFNFALQILKLWGKYVSCSQDTIANEGGNPQGQEINELKGKLERTNFGSSDLILQDKIQKYFYKNV